MGSLLSKKEEVKVESRETQTDVVSIQNEEDKDNFKMEIECQVFDMRKRMDFQNQRIIKLEKRIKSLEEKKRQAKEKEKILKEKKVSDNIEEETLSSLKEQIFSGNLLETKKHKITKNKWHNKLERMRYNRKILKRTESKPAN